MRDQLAFAEHRQAAKQRYHDLVDQVRSALRHCLSIEPSMTLQRYMDSIAGGLVDNGRNDVGNGVFGTANLGGGQRPACSRVQWEIVLERQDRIRLARG